MMTRLLPCLAFTFLAVPAFAEDTLMGPALMTAMAGTTVEGGMADGAVYSEYYDADGTIRAEGYTGTWSIEIDSMCLDYGTDPAVCYRVSLAGDQVTWYIDGVNVGTGTLVPGNPNGY